MSPFDPNRPELAVMKFAQYLAALTSYQDVWGEAGKALVAFFGVNVTAFAQRGANGEVELYNKACDGPNNCEPCSCKNFETIAAQKAIYEAVEETLDSGFLTMRSLEEPVPLSFTFFPITMDNHTTSVLVVGQSGKDAFSKNMLEVFLTVAGLVGATASRLASEQEVRMHKIQLEQLVQERTKELNRANEQLEYDVAARMKAQKGLRMAHFELQKWAARLERRNKEMNLLATMGETLQGCDTVEASLPLLNHALAELVPGCSSFYARFNETDNAFHVERGWPEKTICPSQEWNPEICPALKTEKIIHHLGNNGKAGCEVVKIEQGIGFVCRVLKAGSSTLGFLHIRYPVEIVDDVEGGLEARDQMKLVATAAEHISLALSNLHLQESLLEQSLRDPLTGLYNRRHMTAFLKHETARVKRSEASMGVIMLDVDHFKKFNDTYGHQTGDEVLINLANLLSCHVREGDIVCRYGGEEFLLLLANASLENTTKRAEEIRLAVENGLSVMYKGLAVRNITVSVGLAIFPTHGADGEACIKAADEALYAAKQKGRNCVVSAS